MLCSFEIFKILIWCDKLSVPKMVSWGTPCANFFVEFQQKYLSWADLNVTALKYIKLSAEPEMSAVTDESPESPLLQTEGTPSSRTSGLTDKLSYWKGFGAYTTIHPANTLNFPALSLLQGVSCPIYHTFNV